VVRQTGADADLARALRADKGLTEEAVAHGLA
jgi:hypothetical protein